MILQQRRCCATLLLHGERSGARGRRLDADGDPEAPPAVRRRAARPPGGPTGLRRRLRRCPGRAGQRARGHAGSARRPARPTRHQHAVRQRNGQLVPHGGRASGRQRRRHVCARRSAVRDDATSTGRCSIPTASTRRPSSASGTARSWRRRICSSGSSSPSSPSSSTALVPSCSGTASGPRSCSFRRICWWISIRPRTTSWPRAACPRGR